MPIRVLVADDHEVLRDGIRFMLRHSEEIEIVAEAEDGVQALALIESTDIDVLLLDVKMPNLDGLATLNRVNEVKPDLPVLILSMYDDPAYVEEAIRCGASGYLLKTASAEELSRAIHAAHSGDGYLQPEITPHVLKRFVAQSASQPVDVHLSDREQSVLQLISDGLSTKQIARKLELSESTVKTHLRSLFDKLGASHRAHAVALALRHRLIE